MPHGVTLPFTPSTFPKGSHQSGLQPLQQLFQLILWVLIKIAKGNINNLRYADDTTLMTESEELKSLLVKVKEKSEEFGLKLNVQKTKIMASGPITSWQIDGKTIEIVTDFFLGLQNHCRW